MVAYSLYKSISTQNSKYWINSYPLFKWDGLKLIWQISYFGLPVHLGYVFKSCICNVHLVSFCIHFSFIATVEGLCYILEYRDNIILYFNFVFFLYFFHHSSCHKDQFTVLILKFGAQEFTDPGLLQS